MAAVMAATPLRDSKLATKPMRRMLTSRSSLENERPFDKLVRTTSPSRTSTLRPCARSRSATGTDSVDLPAPDMPVNQSVKPFDMRKTSLTAILHNPDNLMRQFQSKWFQENKQLRR